MVIELNKNGDRIDRNNQHCKFSSKTRTKCGFSSGFSSAFARPINVRTRAGEISMDKLLRELIEFWKRKEATFSRIGRDVDVL